MKILTTYSDLHLELDLPLTSIVEHEDRIGLSSFIGDYCEQDYHCSQNSHFEKHYASQIALRRLCATVHEEIYACKYISDCEGAVCKSHSYTPVVGSFIKWCYIQNNI